MKGLVNPNELWKGINPAVCFMLKLSTAFSDLTKSFLALKCRIPDKTSCLFLPVCFFRKSLFGIWFVAQSCCQIGIILPPRFASANICQKSLKNMAFGYFTNTKYYWIQTWRSFVTISETLKDLTWKLRLGKLSIVLIWGSCNKQCGFVCHYFLGLTIL